MESEANRREHAVEKFGVRKVVIYVILVVWALINLFPVYWMFTFSLKTNEEIFGKNLIAPTFPGYLHQSIFKISNKRFVQIAAHENNSRIPIIVFFF